MDTANSFVSTVRNVKRTLIWNYPTNTNVPAVLMSTLTTVFAVDNSGSTGGSILHDQRNSVLNMNCGKSPLVLWNSKCSRVTTAALANWTSSGGTSPQCIFTPDFIYNINASNLFVLLTDGQIEPYEVINFNNVASKHITHMTSISIITLPSGRADLNIIGSSCNLSVVAPMINLCSDAIVLLRMIDDVSLNNTNHVFRIVQTKGVFETHFKNPVISSKTKFRDLQGVNIDDVLNTKIIIRERPPVGFIPLGTSFINLNEIVNGASLTDQEIITLLEKPVELVQSAQTAGLLSSLRVCIHRVEQQLVEMAKILSTKELNTLLQNEAIGNEFYIMNQIRSLNKTTGENTIEIKRLQAELNQIRKTKAIHDATYNKIYKKYAGDSVIKTQTILALITEIEKVGYSVDALTRLNETNRASRAKQVNIDDIDVKTLDDKNAFAVNCEICCQECGPGTKSIACIRVKLLQPDLASKNISKKNPDGSPALGDAIQTMPFGFGSSEHNRGIFLPDPIMCVDCAKQTNISMLTRDHANGYIPLVDLSNSNNQSIFNSFVYNAISQGKIIPSLLQLFIAILDFHLGNVGFCDEEHPETREAIKYMMKQMLFNINTSKTLQEGGNTVPIITAICHVIDGCKSNENPSTPYIEKYFFAGIACMLRIMKQYSNTGIPDGGFKILHRALLKQFLMCHLSRIKNNNNAIDESRAKFYELAYKCRYGVPISSSAKIIDLNEALSYLPANIVTELKYWCKINHTTISEFIQLPAVTIIWWHMVHLKTHERVDTILEKILTQTSDKAGGPLLNVALLDPKSLYQNFNSDVIEFLNIQFDRGNYDELHKIAIGFTSAAGPSKIRCICGFKFLPTADKNKSYKEKAEIVRKNRSNHFLEVFKSNESGNPSDTSLHYNGHKAVTSTYNSMLSDEENIQAAIKYIVTHDKRGYIHSAQIEQDLDIIVKSFKPFALDWAKNFRRSDVGSANVSLEEMIEWEENHSS